RRSRARHPPRDPVLHLRAVLPRARGGQGRGAGNGDRVVRVPRAHPGPRRQHRGPLRGRVRHHVRVPAAGRGFGDGREEERGGRGFGGRPVTVGPVTGGRWPVAGGAGGGGGPAPPPHRPRCGGGWEGVSLSGRCRAVDDPRGARPLPEVISRRSPLPSRTPPLLRTQPRPPAAPRAGAPPRATAGTTPAVIPRAGTRPTAPRSTAPFRRPSPRRTGPSPPAPSSCPRPAPGPPRRTAASPRAAPRPSSA